MMDLMGGTEVVREVQSQDYSFSSEWSFDAKIGIVNNGVITDFMLKINILFPTSLS